LQKNHQSWSM